VKKYLFLLLLTGCASAPVIPETVTVTVEKFKPLPDWATAPAVKPALKDGKISSHLSREHALDAYFDYTECIKRLTRAFDDGTPVNIKECKK